MEINEIAIKIINQVKEKKNNNLLIPDDLLFYSLTDSTGILIHYLKEDSYSSYYVVQYRTNCTTTNSYGEHKLITIKNERGKEISTEQATDTDNIKELYKAIISCLTVINKYKNGK